jgi:hypothetical protein
MPLKVFFDNLGIKGKWEVDVFNDELLGVDIRTELLLIGFDCPDIERGHAAIWNGYGYFLSNMSGHLESTTSYNIIIPRYQVTRDQVLWSNEVPKKYVEKVYEILSII